MKRLAVLLLGIILCLNAFSKGMHKVEVDNLNMREGPSSTSTVIATLEKGKEVYVHATYREWSKIYFKSREGYVATKYLKKISSPPIVYDAKMKADIQKKAAINKRKLSTQSGFLSKGDGIIFPFVFDRYVLNFTNFSLGVNQKILAIILLGLGLIITFLNLTHIGDKHRLIYEIPLIINSLLVLFYFFAMPNPFWFLNSREMMNGSSLLYIWGFAAYCAYCVMVIYYTFIYFRKSYDGLDLSLGTLFWFVSCGTGLLTAYFIASNFVFLGLILLLGSITYHSIRIFKGKDIKAGLYPFVTYLLLTGASTVMCFVFVNVAAAIIIGIVCLIGAVLLIGFLLSGNKPDISGFIGSSGNNSYGGTNGNSDDDYYESAEEKSSINRGNNRVELEEDWMGNLTGNDGKDYEYTSPFKDKVREKE